MAFFFRSLLLFHFFTLSLGHGNMINPQARDGVSSAGDNKGNAGVGPCGDGNQQIKGAPSANYQSGQTITVTWDIEIPHGGTCVISLSTKTVAQGTNDDNEYQTTGGILDANAPENFDLSGEFPCGANGGTETRQVTIPANAACENCILQWFWDGDQNYYNCADVTILNSGGGVGSNGLLFTDGISTGNMNKVGLGLGILGIILVVGFTGWRLRNIRKNPELVAALGGWPSRWPVVLRYFGLLFLQAGAILIYLVNSFYNCQPALIAAITFQVLFLIHCYLFLYVNLYRPERLEERNLWCIICILDFVSCLVSIYVAFMLSAREYATWIIDSDNGESLETQSQIYDIAIVLSWVITFLLFQSLVHSFGMVGCCMPGGEANCKGGGGRNSKKKVVRSSKKKGGKKSLKSQDSLQEMEDGSRTDSLERSARTSGGKTKKKRETRGSANAGMTQQA